MSDLAERIQQQLKTLKLSATAASVKAGLGKTAIKDILSGKARHPKYNTISKLATALQCSAEYLTGQSDDPNSPKISSAFLRFDPRMDVIKGKLEVGVFRTPPDLDFSEIAIFEGTHLLYNSLTMDGTHELYEVADTTMAGAHILPGDIVTAAADALEETIEIQTGMIVVVRQSLTGGSPYELSLRQVRMEGKTVVFESLPDEGEVPNIVAQNELQDDQNDFLFRGNRYPVAPYGNVVIVGRVVRITRDM